MAEEKRDVARMVEEGARTADLKISPEYLPNVILNVERALVIAQPLLELELDDDLMSAPVFRP
jgi:hypothetical protein